MYSNNSQILLSRNGNIGRKMANGRLLFQALVTHNIILKDEALHVMVLSCDLF